MMSNIVFIVRTVEFSPQRKLNVDKLKKEIPNLIVYTDKKRDGYDSFFKACEIINKTGGVMLEDDVILCDNFVERITKIITENGKGKIINFFERPKTYFKTGDVGGSNFLWMQCTYFPPNLPNKIVSYHDQFKEEKPKKWQGMATDCLIAYALVKEKMKYTRVRPCLVQHLPFDSVIGNRPNNRQTLYFVDDLENEGVNYEDIGR